MWQHEWEPAVSFLQRREPKRLNEVVFRDTDDWEAAHAEAKNKSRWSFQVEGEEMGGFQVPVKAEPAGPHQTSERPLCCGDRSLQTEQGNSAKCFILRRAADSRDVKIDYIKTIRLRKLQTNIFQDE